MGVLQRFERRIEALVNRPFAKAFRAEVEPVEIAAALQRECDDKAAIVAKGRTLVPNAFTVELGGHDYDRLASYEQPMAAELADMVREHAEEQRYSFVGPISIRFEQVDDLDTGMLRVKGEGAAGEVATAHVAALQPPAWLEWSGTRITIDPPVVLGRAPEVDVRLDDPGVSRRHARIARFGDDDVISDLGSTNGVLHNGEPVHEATLHDGDRITLGTTQVVYRRPE